MNLSVQDNQSDQEFLPSTTVSLTDIFPNCHAGPFYTKRAHRALLEEKLARRAARWATIDRKERWESKKASNDSPWIRRLRNAGRCSKYPLRDRKCIQYYNETDF